MTATVASGALDDVVAELEVTERTRDALAVDGNPAALAHQWPAELATEVVKPQPEIQVASLAVVILDTDAAIPVQVQIRRAIVPKSE